MDVKNFRFKDKDGNVLYEFPITGVAPDITVSASVDNNIGTPSVTVTKSGENDSPTYQLDFKNLKGDTGAQGIQGVQGVQGVQGPPVTLDTSVSTTSHNGVENQAITNYVNILNRNTIGTEISLMSYTEASPYIAPSDGYVRVINLANVYGQAYILGNNNSYNLRLGANAEGDYTTYVRRGMKLYPSANHIPSALVFNPITN